MNLYRQLVQDVRYAIRALQDEGKLPNDLSSEHIEVTPTRESSHGDAATNAAMVLAGPAKLAPRAIAELLLPKLQLLPDVESAEIAGPGFINLRFAPKFWQQILPVILKEGERYGDSMLGEGVKINVEYVSTNPTGPVHIGHARGAVYGDVLCNLLKKAGFDVTREYYINDAGGQIDKLADSAFFRYRQALGEEAAEMPEGLYPGDYLVPVGKSLATIHGRKLLEQSREAWLPVVRRYAVEQMMELIKDDLTALGIRHDVFASEWEMTQAGSVDQALKQLEEKGLIYVGVLEPPKGKMPDDWEPRPQTLFKSSAFGDDLDRAIKKSDGSWTYFAPDIAYHFDKYQRGHTRMIDVMGADHGGYAKRIKAAVKALSDNKAELEVKLCQMVKFLRNGEPAKMSKRAGTFVTVRDVLDEVGKDVLRFIMLTRKNDAPLDFDLEKVTEQSKDNPVFYVQYAHARCHSVLRMAYEQAPDALKLATEPTAEIIAGVSHPAEIELVKTLAAWPRIVEAAATAYEPHRIAFYLQDVAASFHAFWTKGNDDISLRFIVKDAIKTTASRLVLARAVAGTIAAGLHVLGVQPLEEMR